VRLMLRREPMADTAPEMVETLARHALFCDLPADAAAELARAVVDRRYAEGDWVLRRGEANCGLHVILDGEAGVLDDDVELAVLHAGMFFGEISALLDEPVGQDVVARTPLRCAVIERDRLLPFLLDQPAVTLRLLRAEARRVSDANRWRA
jgi:CRP/FNR family transcriptional regulator, cyclic AMP receptor protein